MYTHTSTHTSAAAYVQTKGICRSGASNLYVNSEAREDLKTLSGAYDACDKDNECEAFHFINKPDQKKTAIFFKPGSTKGVTGTSSVPTIGGIVRNDEDLNYINCFVKK